MRRWHMAQQSLKSLFLVALILVSCSAPSSDNPQEGCGGTEAAVSCLRIVNIVPTGGINVDAAAHACRDITTGAVTSIEKLTDHNADVTFSNVRFPTASTTTTFDIRVVGYSVAYQ